MWHKPLQRASADALAPRWPGRHSVCHAAARRLEGALIALFCAIDDFCKTFEPIYHWRLLHTGQRQRTRQTTLALRVRDSKATETFVLLHRKTFDMLTNGVSHQRRRPFVDEFRTFCLSCPGVKDTFWGLDDTLQELLYTRTHLPYT